MSQSSSRTPSGSAPRWPAVPRPVVKTQPVGVLTGVLLGTQPTVSMVDQVYGADLALSGITILASLVGAGTLLGTASELTDGTGRATWDDLIIVGLGTFQIKFDAGAYGSVVSGNIGL